MYKASGWAWPCSISVTLVWSLGRRYNGHVMGMSFLGAAKILQDSLADQAWLL